MNTSWSHLICRPVVRPLIALGVRPNHVTAARLVIGLVVLGTIAFGSDHQRFLAGLGWLIACLFDRLDGELARIGNMCSAAGHRFDYLVDMWMSALFFVALGLSVHGPHHLLATGCGILACTTQLLNGMVAERFDSLSGADGKVLASKWGFDADDALYILGPLAWLPDAWRFGTVALAAIGTAGFLILFVFRLQRLRARLASH